MHLLLGLVSPNIAGVNTRRIQILDSAAELISTKGFAQTSVDELIAYAGLSGKSHFYHYFKSKEQLEIGRAHV